MAHVLFVDGTGQVFRAMRTALNSGHRISFISQVQHPAIPDWKNSEVGRTVAPLLTCYRELDTTGDAAAVTAAAQKIDARMPVDAIICLFDYAMQGAAKAARVLGVPFNTPEATTSTLDKGRMRKCIDRVPDLRNAKSISVCGIDQVWAAADTIRYPVFIKPTYGANSVAAFHVPRSEDMAAALLEFETAISNSSNPALKGMSDRITVEEYLEGRMVTVELYLQGGQPRVFMITEILRNKEDDRQQIGMMMPAPLDESLAQDIRDYAVEITKGIGLSVGIVHIEMIVGEDGPIVLEVNPRIMGGTMPNVYADLTAQDPFENMIDLHLGKPTCFPDPYSRGGLIVLSVRNRRAAMLGDVSRLRRAIESFDPTVTIIFNTASGSGQTLAPNGVIGRLEIRGRTSAKARDTAISLLKWLEAEHALPLLWPGHLPRGALA